MKKETYKLSNSGIERLKAFKADIENGDINIDQVYVRQRLEPLYFVVSSRNGSTCAFRVKNNDEAIKSALQDIEVTLSNKIEKRFHSCGTAFYCSEPDGGVALNRDDVTKLI